MKGFSKTISSLISFLVEIVVYAGFIIAYFVLVLKLVGPKIKPVFDANKTHYALMAVGLMVAQGYVMERLTTGFLLVINSLQAMGPVLYRLFTPYEEIAEVTEVPGLVTYRFGGPLYYFNAAYFSHRVNDVIAAAEKPVKFFLVNAAAITDIDMNGLDILEELYQSLRKRGITLGFCEVKGDFRHVLQTTRLPRRPGFKIFSSVAAAVAELGKEPASKKGK